MKLILGILLIRFFYLYILRLDKKNIASFLYNTVHYLVGVWVRGIQMWKSFKITLKTLQFIHNDILNIILKY